MSTDPKYQRVAKAFTFLRERATDSTLFTVADVMAATGWKKNSVDTYMIKQWKDVLTPDGKGSYRAKAEFRRLSLEDFKQLISQKRKIFSQYRRVEFGRVVTYEFLLPLTKEDKLREALDELFYTDTIHRRLQEMELTDVIRLYPKDPLESDRDWLNRVSVSVGDRFGGYSILHVHGRFRSDSIKSREAAAAMLLNDQRYLIDETTALVRFVIPVEVTRKLDPRLAGTFSFEDFAGEGDIAAEVATIRWSFFSLFAEAIVRTIQGEDEIWLVEDTGSSRRLYVWERS